ncbi:hypothetical protein D6D01_05978 [Aureobasidium pullulans]|uniref:Peptidase S28 n=1 Tax=Aureobasidium pullulans TaxID=5580 RepID=A0A4S9L4C0_AURPU|nr:hypothetical protein D6D01_05978 [Aureobasidium pullulans]
MIDQFRIFFILLGVLLGVTAAKVRGPRPQLPLSGGLTKREVQAINVTYPALTLEIPVDHFNGSDKRTYNNRYWINDEHYKAGGPVFYFDSGEQDAHPLVPYFLHEIAGPSSLMALARRFNGIAVVFEHRFYGRSFPLPISTTSGRAVDDSAYRYLNTEQALGDVIYFSKNFRPAGSEPYWSMLDPKYTPWIWLGGSYPGIRGAIVRIRNPETFFATWASSAPTEARVDFWQYYAQAERSMTRNCSADYTHVTNWVDSVLSNGTEQEVSDLKYQLYTAVLSGPGGQAPETVNRSDSDILENADVASYLTLPLSFYQYYGFEASVQPFCDTMETMNETLGRTTDNGGTSPAIASESGIVISYNISMAWSAFLMGIAEIDYDQVPYTDDPVQDVSWQYQYCSEYGYYQRGNPENPRTIQSKFTSLQLFQDGCNEAFPGLLPSEPNVSIPLKYGGWNMNPSNTLWTSGEYDPWRALSPASIEEGAPGRRSVQNIPDAGVSPPDNEIFGLVYRDMVHVSDMRVM